MNLTIDNVVSRIRIVRDSLLSPSTVKEIIFRILYLMIADIIKNGVTIRLPKRNNCEPYISISQISENTFESVYVTNKNIDRPDYFSSLHKAYHITIKRAGFEYYSPIDLDDITFNKLVDRISSGFNYSSATEEKDWKEYVYRISKYYPDINPAAIRSIMFSAISFIYKISNSDDVLDMKYSISDDYVFRISVGNTIYRKAINNSQEIPNFITFPEFDGYYYIPISYDKAVFLSRNRFNSLKHTLVTTSLDFAKMRSKYVIRIDMNKDYGKNAVIDNIKFRDFAIISSEPGFRKEFLLVKYLNNPVI